MSKKKFYEMKLLYAVLCFILIIVTVVALISANVNPQEDTAKDLSTAKIEEALSGMTPENKITAGVAAVFRKESKYGINVFRFIAPETAQYAIYSTGAEDTYCTLRKKVKIKDSQGNLLSEDFEIIAKDDDSLDKKNFLLKINLEKGDECLIAANVYAITYPTKWSELRVEIIPDKIELNKTSANLKVGEYIGLKVSPICDNNLDLQTQINPDKKIAKEFMSSKVKWTSSDKKIANVTSDGKVVAIATGNVKITAVSIIDGSLKAVCDVKVEKTEKTNEKITEKTVEKIEKAVKS